MKGFTLMVQFVRCGFGWSGGIVPELRLGLLRIGVCRGWVWDALDRSRTALGKATAFVRGVGA